MDPAGVWAPLERRHEALLQVVQVEKASPCCVVSERGNSVKLRVTGVENRFELLRQR
jgi:hypothetical protein